MDNFEELLKDSIITGIKTHAEKNNRPRVHELISTFRQNGTDYPEFDEIHRDLYKKEPFLRDILTKYRAGDSNYAKKNIELARKNGYDYPEFVAIEKSIANKEK